MAKPTPEQALENALTRLRSSRRADRVAGAKALRKWGSAANAEAVREAWERDKDEREAWEVHFQLGVTTGALGCVTSLPVLEELAARSELLPMSHYGVGYGLWELKKRDEHDGSLVLDLLRRRLWLGKGAMVALALRHGKPEPSVVWELLRRGSEDDWLTSCLAYAAAGWLDLPGVRQFLASPAVTCNSVAAALAADAVRGQYFKRWAPV